MPAQNQAAHATAVGSGAAPARTRVWRGALIGCGFFARNHMHGWAAAEGAAIVAVCDRDRGRAEAFARDFGVAEAHDDAAAMLRAVQPDFVDVATTVESHRALVELALAHGALTICQKPFAPSYADGRAMVEAAERAARPLIVHENFRWQRPFRLLRARLDAGAIGAPRFARIVFRHGYPELYAKQPYLAEVEDFALMDVGLHLFDVARFLLGDVARLACETQRRNPRVRGEDAFTALLRHRDGAVASVECSFHSQIAPDPFPETLIWLEGDAGTLELDFGYRLRLHRDGAVEETSADPPAPAWGARPWHAVQDSVAAFEAHVVDVLEGRAAPQPSGAHNLETLAMALAAYRSAARRETVDLEAFVAAGCPR
jgi:predicted dehydrogenase